MTPAAQTAWYILSACLVVSRILRLRLGLVPALILSLVFVLIGYPYLRGFVGDLSVTLTLILLFEFPKTDFFGASKDTRWPRGASILLGAGLILYPSSIFVLPWHAYEWGFSGSGYFLLMLVLFLGAGIYWYWRRSPLAVVLLLTLAAYHARLLESDNLWDYLIDPILFLWAAGEILLALARKCRKG